MAKYMTVKNDGKTDDNKTRDSKNKKLQKATKCRAYQANSQIKATGWNRETTVTRKDKVKKINSQKDTHRDTHRTTERQEDRHSNQLTDR